MATLKNGFEYDPEVVNKRYQQSIATNPTGLLTPTTAAQSNLKNALNKQMGFTSPAETSTLTTPAILSADGVAKYTPGKVMEASTPAKKTTTYTTRTNTQNQQYIDQLNSLYGQYMNRKPFQYDLNGDMLYRQMADQYTRMGKIAMMDTMGQAAALTGGYGNSFAQSVGNQAYQQYLMALNEQVPSLYGQALNAYLAEGDRMLQMYQLAAEHPGIIGALSPKMYTYKVEEEAPDAGSSSGYSTALAGAVLGSLAAQPTVSNALADWYYELLNAEN